MAVEHADTGAEAVERPPAVEAPPPPPPDRPGAEDFPSRAESRAAASAAFDQSRRSDDTTEAGSDTSAAEAAEEQDASHGDRTESSPAPERDEPDARESAAWDSPAGTDHDPVDEGEQQPHSEKAFHSETATDELAPVDTDAQPESLDHRTPPSSEEVDARDRPIAVDAPAETADDQRPDDLAPPVDLPGAEPETLPSGAEGSARTAAVVEAETDQVSDTADVEVPVPAPEIGQQAQPSGDSPAGRLGDTSDRPGSGEALNAGESGIAESMEPAEGQAAITQVRSDDAADGTDLVNPPDALGQMDEADEATGLDGAEQESSGDGGGLS
ncbi:MAG: hypothetical protein ACRDYV_21615, partial [Acidimicrobiia bacterium]